MSEYLKKKEEMIEVVRRFHRGQALGSDESTPYWKHCLRVNQVLETIFLSKQNKIPTKIQNILIACLGHDLYEDTEIDSKIIIDKFGKEVDQLINQVTNEIDDQHQIEFMQKLRAASSSALIIKMADSIENNLSISYTLPNDKVKWAKKFYLPIATNNYKLLSEAKLQYHKKEVKKLKQLLEVSYKILLLNLKRHD